MLPQRPGLPPKYNHATTTEKLPFTKHTSAYAKTSPIERKEVIPVYLLHNLTQSYLMTIKPDISL